MTKDKILFSLLFIFILTIGITVRVARFPELPPGLNQDEANSATETYALLKTGKDKWGNTYPAYFPSWGSGQSVLMAYLSIPAVKAFGLNIFSTRLISLLLGILTLPLFFYCLLPLGRVTALLGLLIVSVVPWHFMLSRWALECNLAPFFMLWGVFTLIKALDTQQKKWIIPSLLPFGLALYAYGSTVIVLAVFMMIVIAMHYKLLYRQWQSWLMAAVLFSILAFPFFLYFLENYIIQHNLAWTDSLFFSTPICPMNRLDQSEAPGLMTWNKNIEFLFSGCDDHTNYNLLYGFSLLLPFILPLSFIGLLAGSWMLIKNRIKQAPLTLSIFIAWAFASLVLLYLFDLNVNRFCHFFQPCIALAAWMISLIPAGSHSYRYIAQMVIGLLFLGESGLAMHYYFNDYRNDGIKPQFNAGLEEAFQAVKDLPADQIRITENMRLPYVYTLFYLEYPPDKFQREAQYEIKDGIYKVNRFGEYVFFEEYLDHHKSFGYLSRKNEYQDSEELHKKIVFSNEDWEVGVFEYHQKK